MGDYEDLCNETSESFDRLYDTINTLNAEKKALCRSVDIEATKVARLRERCRTACQVLVEQVGASGPCNVEDAAEKAAVLIVRLREDYETSHASRMHADGCVLRLEAERERLRNATQRQCGYLTSVIETGRHDGAESALRALEAALEVSDD